MKKYSLQTQHVPKYTVAQSSALEAIGKAFKGDLIDFEAATELRDLVRAGRTDEASAALDTLTLTRTAQESRSA